MTPNQATGHTFDDYVSGWDALVMLLAILLALGSLWVIDQIWPREASRSSPAVVVEIDSDACGCEIGMYVASAEDHEACMDQCRLDRGLELASFLEANDPNNWNVSNPDQLQPAVVTVCTKDEMNYGM